MKDVIEMLLSKKATLEEDCEFAKQVEIERIENEFAERKQKINALLDLAGYVEPVEEPVETDELTEESEASAPVAPVGQIAY